MQELGSRARARVASISSALIVFISSYLFFVEVPFLPSPPVVPLIAAVGLGGVSLRSRGAAISALYILAYFSILWQMIGFGFFQLLHAGIGLVVLFLLAAPLVGFANRKVDLSSMALAILAVALMMTPAYFVSIPLLAAAASMSGFMSLGALSATFIFLLTPLLLLENSLYYTLDSSATAPVIFSQLTTLVHALRPPLTGLNIFLTGLPTNYLSQYSDPVSRFLIHNSSFLVIPLIIFGVVLVVSSFVGAATRSLVDRFLLLRQTGLARSIVTPLAVAVATPVAFILLIIPLSLPGTGGFQSSLLTDSSHVQAGLMVVSSVILVASFAGRESLVKNLEHVEVTVSLVSDLDEECRTRIGEMRRMMDEVSRRAPSLNLRSEEASVEEYSSYLEGVERQMASATKDSATEWAERIEKVILPSLKSGPIRLRERLSEELRGLASVTMTVNSHLEEAGAPLRYQEVKGTEEEAVDELMKAYDAAASKVTDCTLKLFESYRSTSGAYDSLMGLGQVNPPIEPTTLLDSHDYVSAMRLVSEEYWLNFHLRTLEELEGRKAALLNGLEKLQRGLTDDERARVRLIAGSVEQARPSGSVQLAHDLDELSFLLSDAISRRTGEAALLEDMVGALEPRAMGLLKFQTIGQLGGMRQLEEELKGTGRALAPLAAFLVKASPILEAYSVAWKNDQENLIVLAQYPLARRVMQATLKRRGSVQLSSLPFQRSSAATYARLYASTGGTVVYEEAKEELRLKDA